MAAVSPPPTPGTEGQLLAAGLYQLLSPVVEECDARIQEVMDSQAHLSQQIETLAADLDHFMTFTQTPPLAAHLQRLLNARNRLVTINTTLLTIMNRLDRISAGVDPAAAKERKSSIGGFFNKKKDSQNLPQTSQPPQTPPLSQLTHSQEQPPQPTPQETKDTTTPNESKENNDNESEPPKEISSESQEQK